MLLVRYYDIVIGYIIGPIFRYTCHTASENLDAQLLRNDTSFLSNLLCKLPLINYSPTIFVRLFQPIHWYETRILTFSSEQRAASTDFHHVYMQSFPQRAIITAYHSNVQVPISVTCLNFAVTGSRLYVAFVMTWYLAFTTSGCTAKAVRPVISGKERYYFSKQNITSNVLQT